MKRKLLTYGLFLMIGIAAGYVIKDQLTPPCETQVIKKAKIKGQNNTMSVQQVEAITQKMEKDCEERLEKELKKAEKQWKRKAKKKKRNRD